ETRTIDLRRAAGQAICRVPALRQRAEPSTASVPPGRVSAAQRLARRLLKLRSMKGRRLAERRKDEMGVVALHTAQRERDVRCVDATQTTVVDFNEEGSTWRTSDV